VRYRFVTDFSRRFSDKSERSVDVTAKLYLLRQLRSPTYLFSHYTDQCSSVYIPSHFIRAYTFVANIPVIFLTVDATGIVHVNAILFVCRRPLFFYQSFDVHFHPFGE